MDTDNQILIYQSKDGNIKIDVHLQDESVWLTQEQMGQLFGKDKRTVPEHIGNIFKEGELNENMVVRKFRTTTLKYSPFVEQKANEISNKDSLSS